MKALLEKTDVQISNGVVNLSGTLVVPQRAAGAVLFAHGSGSGRHSPRNRFVAEELNHAGFATLLLDLLTEEEEAEDRWRGHLRFDVSLLSGRLVAATDWLAEHDSTASLPLGYFGASTGSAAALIAATRRPDRVRAVVSRGGRPDMAMDALPGVQAPTLLIVGGADEAVVEMNEEALNRLACERRLAVVPGATHLFEEPGALESVAHLAADWFRDHLTGKR